ncbi:hypothetical protein VFPPC_15071 [Pochonia chlamydosporia 170]|uniref:Uncharacterized protein n=1 Tax=Pochonia chlamydosporia 170 TaxID=1380566 RepID=A0A179G4R1_METCM|nr:hypothetical protein VFPPC_15071 [Pochonia chlamydosporia 170]OAQ72139.1 hypothetical protein VFPPC_15071 [Pochonia chlamydosporia 170]
MTFTVMTPENTEREVETNSAFQTRPADEAYKRSANMDTLLGSTCWSNILPSTLVYLIRVYFVRRFLLDTRTFQSEYCQTNTGL